MKKAIAAFTTSILIVSLTTGCPKKEEKSFMDMYIEFLVLQFLIDQYNNSCRVLTASAPNSGSYLTAGLTEKANDYGTGGIIPMAVDGEKVTKWFNTEHGPVEFTAIVTDRGYLVDGDMLFTEEQISDSFGIGSNDPNPYAIAGAKSTYHWPKENGYYRVQYEWGSLNAESKAYLQDAMAHWEEHSDFRFFESSTGNRILMQDDSSGCNSYVGMINTGQQELNLAPACGLGAAIHEIGHALGISHEHQRPDRDEHVNIVTENIETGKESNFNKKSADDVITLGDYDFLSIMHYGGYAFSVDYGNKPTITKKDGTPVEAQRDGLSTCDVKTLHELYEGEGSSN